MKVLSSFLLFICFVTSVGCSPIRVINQEAAEQFSLGFFKTYAFYVEEPTNPDSIPTSYNQYVQLIKREIGNQLATRGLTLNSTSPDLMINLGVVVSEKSQTRTTNFLNDAPIYMGQRRYSWKSKEIEVNKYKQGTISLHLVDTKTNEMVWKGEAEAVIPKKGESLEKRIKKGVNALFEKIR